MHRPPRNLSPEHFADLLRVIPDARQLLGVSDRTLRRWLASGQVPHAAVVLLWFASPIGREDAARDLADELALVALQRDALLRQIEAMKQAAVPGRFGDRTANDWMIPEALCQLSGREKRLAGGRWADVPVADALVTFLRAHD